MVYRISLKRKSTSNLRTVRQIERRRFKTKNKALAFKKEFVPSATIKKSRKK